MLERFIHNKKLDAAKLSAKKLLSARGEANAQSMAIKLIDHYEHLDKRSQIDFFHFLSSQFNPGFLELHQITWNSPAQLLEKIISHESVHAIDGWDDLRRRL